MCLFLLLFLLSFFINVSFILFQQLEKEISASEANMREADRVAAERARVDDVGDHNM